MGAFPQPCNGKPEARSAFWGQDARTAQAALAGNYFPELHPGANNSGFTKDTAPRARHLIRFDVPAWRKMPALVWPASLQNRL